MRYVLFNWLSPEDLADWETWTPAPQQADAEAQRQADAAQRERMRQAMAQQAQGGTPPTTAAAAETPEQREQRQAVEAWMRRVPDDPGSLLRAKFRLEQERRQREGP